MCFRRDSSTYYYPGGCILPQTPEWGLSSATSSCIWIGETDRAAADSWFGTSCLSSQSADLSPVGARQRVSSARDIAHAVIWSLPSLIHELSLFAVRCKAYARWFWCWCACTRGLFSGGWCGRTRSKVLGPCWGRASACYIDWSGRRSGGSTT